MNKLYKDIRYVGGEISLAYTVKTKPSERTKIYVPEEAVSFLKAKYDDSIYFKEDAYALVLDNASKLLGIVSCGSGDLGSCWIDRRKIMTTVILCNARYVILCHNHPSGVTRPSKDDDKITKALDDGLKAIDASLLDHVILAPEGDYYSYRDYGRI